MEQQEIDPRTIDAKNAYVVDGHCSLTQFICKDGDCRKCSFISDYSTMMSVDMIMHELNEIKYVIDPDYEGEDGCNCGCCHEDGE